ncbi:hypothetical protein Vretifemale_19398 [Volvox reticuliferus]|uniref:Uncharacterized protein n=1 Tax=Volvox reticuliferus TaxID=1737510 RepID=A0A8J4CZC2_9CHLO|nr:hypothetical protein Vretifemale_19398 [Volvox reticuliferus]
MPEQTTCVYVNTHGECFSHSGGAPKRCPFIPPHHHHHHHRHLYNNINKQQSSYRSDVDFPGRVQTVRPTPIVAMAPATREAIPATSARDAPRAAAAPAA